MDRLVELASRIRRAGLSYSAGGKLYHRYDGRSEESNQVHYYVKDEDKPDGVEATEVLPEVVVTPYGNYLNYTGSETVAPSLDDFTDAKASAARVNAVGNILTTEHPVVPAVPGTIARGLIHLGVPEETAIRLFGYSDSPHTCIATTTAQYNDPEAFYAGNKTFDRNPVGYVQVGDYDYTIGDLINLYEKGEPYHSTMVTGVERSPYDVTLSYPLITYSNGGIDTEGEPTHMQYSKNNLYDDNDENTPDFGVLNGNVGSNTYKVFRYVGSPSQQAIWEQEYNSKFGDAPTRYEINVPQYQFITTDDGKIRVERK